MNIAKILKTILYATIVICFIVLIKIVIVVMEKQKNEMPKMR